jgi:predicted dehydrogenase
VVFLSSPARGSSWLLWATISAPAVRDAGLVAAEVVEAIAGRGEPAAGADDGVASLSVALAVLEAARTGRAVAVDRGKATRNQAPGDLGAADR